MSLSAEVQLHKRYIHIKDTKHTHSEPLICDLITDVVCVRVYSSSSQRTAVSECESLDRYICQKCNYETNSRNELEYHNETMHWEKFGSTICKTCDTKYSGSITKENHRCFLPEDDLQNTCNCCKINLSSRETKINQICKQHFFETVEQQILESTRANTECKNRLDCWRATRNKCLFMDTVQINVSPHQG